MKYSNAGSFNFNTFYNYSEMDKQNGGFVSGTYNTVSTAKQTGIYANTNLNAVNYNTQLETIPYQTGGGSAGLQSCSSVLAGQGISGITGVTSVAQNLNEGNAVMIGGEASIEFKPMEPVNLNFGITRVVAYLNGFNAAFAKLNAVATANGTPIDVLGHQLGYVQPLTITAGGSWDMKDFVPGLAFNWLIKSWPTYHSNTLQQNYGSALYNPQNITNLNFCP